MVCARSATASLLVLSLALVGLERRAEAACTSTGEALALKNSLQASLSCAQQSLLTGPSAVCTIPAPPACAGALSTDVTALVFGPNNPAPSGVSATPSGLKAQLGCQQEMVRDALKYAANTLFSLIKGAPSAQAEATWGTSFDPILTKCNVPVKQDASGVVLPSVGPQCAAALGPPGTMVDAAALRGCLHTLLSVWVDRVAPNAAPLRPNILVILTDDQRFDTTSSEHGIGGAAVMPRTRAELVSSGVELTRAFVPTPLCTPSRASLLTGQYAHTSGTLDNLGPWNALAFDDTATLATALKAAGYRTGFYGKYLFGYDLLWTSGAPPYVPPGWDDWNAFVTPGYRNYFLVENGATVFHGASAADYSTDLLRDEASAFIDASVAANEPFFVLYAPFAPNSPKSTAPAAPATRHLGDFAGLSPFRPPSYNEADFSDKPVWLQALPLMSQAEQDMIDAYRPAQLEMLQAVDEAVGGSVTHGITGLMDKLRMHGIDDDTIVLFMSDNSTFWGEHRFTAQYRPYDENFRVPFFARYPKLAPLPRVETRMVLNIDIAPTLIELAGATAPVAMDGVSLVRVLDGTAPTWRTDMLTEGWSQPEGSQWASVRDAQWMYTEYPLGESELYDLAADPYQLTNVRSVPANAPRAAAMASRLMQLRPGWPADLP